MTDTRKCLRAYAVGDEDVTDGSVENYDFDWGDPVVTPNCRCDNCTGCQNRCGCRCGCGETCGCGEEADPEPDPDPVEEQPACSCTRCKSAVADGDTYPIVDL